MPGNCMSTIRQAAFRADPEARNSSAESKLSTAYPADSMQSSSDCRTSMSSSMIAMLPFNTLLT